MLKYWIWLTTRKGLGPCGTDLLMRRFSTPEQAYFASEEAYAQIPGLRKTASLMDKDLTGAQRILEQCRQKGICVMTYQDAAYPRRLRELEGAPYVLYYRGILPDLNAPMIAVVGTRKSTQYGNTQARKLGYELAACGCTVLSGGAAGIDTCALQGAVQAGGTAVAIVACGLDVTYPSENAGLFRKIMEASCLISEYPPGTPPLRYNFPARNRILSGMSLGVLVVEAPKKSGALITAHSAMEQGKELFVLPANVGQASTEGNLQLLRECAYPVAEVGDILQHYQEQYPQIQIKQQIVIPQQPPEATCDKKVIDKPKTKAYIDVIEDASLMTETEQKLVRQLCDGARHIDALVEESGLSSGLVLSTLTMLEVRGIIRHTSARVYELAEKQIEGAITCRRQKPAL